MFRNTEMKRKPPAAQLDVVPSQMLERARKSVEADSLKRPVSCVVCGDPCAPNSAEGLCWVCRRLKISAWRESEQQMPAPE